MKSKKQIRHRNKSKKFRKMKGAGGRPSRPRATIEGDANVNPLQNQGAELQRDRNIQQQGNVAAPTRAQIREDIRQEERRLQLEEQHRIVEAAQRRRQEEHDRMAAMAELEAELEAEAMMNQNAVAGEGLDQDMDQDMIDAIAVAENFDAMNEREQNIQQQQQAEGGGGRVTNRFASGLRGIDNPHVPVRQTKNRRQRIPLNPNPSLPTTDERNIDRRILGFEAEDHNMTTEQYEDYIREQMSGNWRNDYIRLQERRERERLAEQMREQRRSGYHPSRQPERNLYQPDSLGTIAYNSLLNIPVDTKEEYETIKEATEIPDDYFDFIRGSKSALRRKIRNVDMMKFYKNQPSHLDKKRFIKKYVDARRRELINRYDNDEDSQNTLYYLSENIGSYGGGYIRVDERQGVENDLFERISTNNNLVNTPMMDNGYGDYNYQTLLMTVLREQEDYDNVFDMNSPEVREIISDYEDVLRDEDGEDVEDEDGNQIIVPPGEEEVMNVWIENNGRGRGGLVNLLIEMGADVNARDDYNNTPLHYVAQYRRGENARIIDVLLNPNNIRNMQNPPYINQDLPYNYDLLRQEGADINAINFEGNTPLHIAIINQNFNVARELLRRSARPDIRNRYGETILDIADFFNVRDSVEDIIFNYYIIPRSTLDEISNEESSRLRRLDNDSLNQVKKFLPGGKRKTKKRKTRRRKTRKH